MLQKVAHGQPGVQVIARAAEILRTLAAHPEGLSLAQIAQEVELPRSTIERIVHALRTEQLVRSLSLHGPICLGPGLVTLATEVGKTMRQEMRPALEDIVRQSNETVTLALWEGEMLVCIDQVVSSSQRLRAVSAVGEAFPLYCTANGKAILAELPPGQVERLLPAELEPLTPYTITSRQQFLAELETVRLTHVAYEREEHTRGICAISTTRRDSLGNLAAITIMFPALRFHKQQELTTLLIPVAHKEKERGHE
jgi:DNA-binding IclR family transcriptional regulator